ncbi:MAG: cobalamin B12-binding domain-containing protein [Actinobacteria bacterium]|nr:cobalamin B12-binding domain-containing protein [Actinomycetota bacterium]MDI6829832.1 cobalamin-dependent protein [Actinomycetota bacterium]
MEKKTRVLLFKPGLDGHWRGIMTVSKALSEAGMETIFFGFKTVEGVVEAAIQEDVDVIGFSVHSGAHLEWARELVRELDEKGVRGDFLLLIGGVFPEQDHAELMEIGIDGVFGPGTVTADIVKFIEENLKRRVSG